MPNVAARMAALPAKCAGDMRCCHVCWGAPASRRNAHEPKKRIQTAPPAAMIRRTKPTKQTKLTCLYHQKWKIPDSGKNKNQFRIILAIGFFAGNFPPPCK